MANIMHFMIQPFKVQWEAKNSENGALNALRARLRALRARFKFGQSHFVRLSKTLPMVPLDLKSVQIYYHFIVTP